MYPILVTISLILVLGSSGYMSVSGLLSIFTNSPTVIISMGIGMEVGKVLTVSHLYRSWKSYNQLVRLIYFIIIGVLTLLTSFEVAGFLSRCYQDSTQGSQILRSQIDFLNQEEQILQSQIKTIDQTLNGLPEEYVSRRINERKNSGYDKMRDRLFAIIKEKAELNTKLISTTENKNPVFALSGLIGINDSYIILVLIPLIVLILEPLSIGLTVAANSAWISRKTQEPLKRTLEKTNSPTDELQILQKEHDLSVEKIAEITKRKKLKTCKAWLDGTIPTPPRALAEVQAWIEKKYPDG